MIWLLGLVCKFKMIQEFMKNIAVIGAGTMGNGIAHVFAMHGYNVNLCDIDESALGKAMETIKSNLWRMVAKQKITEDHHENSLKNINTFTYLPDAVKDADLVIEAASESEATKLKLFELLDEHAPAKCILASNTSSISITKIASATNRPSKVIGMHFMNPVPIMKLVEVIRGYHTSDETAQTIHDLTDALEKEPIRVNDYPGFVANRILIPMINESIYTLYQGVAGVKEIDSIMKLGMGHPMGPLELADFIGLDVCLSILEVLYEGFKESKYAPCPLLVNMVQAGDLGKKSGMGFYDYTEEKKAEKVAKNFL